MRPLPLLMILALAANSASPLILGGFGNTSRHRSSASHLAGMGMNCGSIPSLRQYVAYCIAASMIVPAYQAAVQADHSTLLVEFTEYYKEARGGA